MIWRQIAGAIRKRAGLAVLVFGLAMFTWSGAARAQQVRGFDVQLFVPPPTVGSTFLIDSPRVPRHLNAVFGVAASYALNPFVVTERASGEERWLLAHHTQADILAALGLFEWIEFGLAMPVSYSEVARDAVNLASAASEGVIGASDLRLTFKVPLLRGDFAISGRFVTTLPTGDSHNFLGAGHWTLYPAFVLAWNLEVIRFAGELGYRFRQRRALGAFEQDDELQILLGALVPVVDELDLVLDLQGRLGVGGRSFEAPENPVDVNAGARIHIRNQAVLEVGVGTAVLAGYGAPLIRGFAMFRFATEDVPCASGPEDYDGHQDEDFCADLDNDEDGFDDRDDLCVNDPEDRDGFADDDGCPDPDNDADSVLDADDACPVQSEDIDGFADRDGCPEPDNDEDGVQDGSDQCPMEPEDADLYQDEDGCPEPGPAAAAVTVTDTRILIGERIYFEFDTDTIRSVSAPLLDQVAAAVRQIDSALRIRVEGYTDDQGNHAYNLDLSYRRARAVVEYLASRGVRRARLEYRGFGADHPVAPNDSPEGRALNRRVEFTILQPGEPVGGGR